ncbi:hypothetical protein [Paenibacillus sp. PL91]|uniref:hypothetical protein n=1 Tax=Paenibacillus sp. PL91 TaxID=2729538 RepID=UPI00145F023A|nr:hypothetical protein [Paenibacillus sp. PL91]MBC9203860.1 hypothetical protein [Paenibacillus sp. PL91]
MSFDIKNRHKARVEVILDIIKEISEKETIPEAFKHKLNAMSYDDLGTFVMEIVKTRSIDEILKLKVQPDPSD